MKKYHNILLLFGKSLVTAGLLVYFIFTIKNLVGDYEQAKIKALNRIRPISHDNLIAIKHKNKSPDIKDLKLHAYYYQRVTETIPRRADAYGLLGFCHYYLGETEKAVDFYQKAIEIRPDFFWFHFNLSVIHFNKGRYTKAIASAQKALGTDLKKSLAFILGSQRIYMPVVSKRINAYDDSLKQLFEAGYKDCYVILMLSYYYLNDYPQVIRQASYPLRAGRKDGDLFFFYSGLASFHMNQYVQAISFFQETLKRNSQIADAYHYLGLCFLSLNKKELGLGALKKADLLKRKGEALDFDDREVTLEIF